jgi:hypothetical protein
VPGVIETLLGLFNVKDYGTRGDGQSNDVPRIHDAILATPPAGGTIIFPPGAYYLGTNVSFQGRTNITLWLTAGASFVGPGALPASAGSNHVVDLTGGLLPSGPASGALAGNYPNPSIAQAAAPTTAAFGDTPAAGASGFAADENHRHGMPAQPINHSVNGLLNLWQRTLQAYTANNGPAGPDGLFITLAGTDTISCTQDTANADTANGAQFDVACAFVLGTGGGASGVQSMSGGHKLTTDNFRFWRGKQITRSWRIRASVAGAVRLAVTTDGTGGATTFSAYHPGDGTWQTLSVTTPVIPADATFVQFKVVCGASTTFYVGAHATTIGGAAADPYLVALSAADDLARALRYYYRFNSPGSGYLLAVGQAVSATQAYLPFLIPVEMAAAPSLTASSVGDFALWAAAGAPQTLTALSMSAQSPLRPGWLATVAANLAAGNAAMLVSLNATGWVALEANP